MISKIRKLVRHLKSMKTTPAETNPFLRFAPPGHFYSPIPDHALIASKSESKLEEDKLKALIADINLNEEVQSGFLREIAHFYPEFPYPAKVPRLRYSFDQFFYCHADAIYLYGMLRYFKPRKIIEVGSGHSSALVLDTNELFLEGELDCTFIEPYPERLFATLRPEEKGRIHIIKSPVQNVPIETFSQLGPGDILFIDSSHVSKYGSDVNYLIFEILPALNAGVVVHIHDIFYPFEYPRQWLLEGRAWNEAYLVRAFLQNNDNWEILLFADFAGRKFQSYLSEHMPLCLKNTGGALWLRKL
jgi:hypothetical protein